LHHTERHAIGSTEFEAKYKINLWKEAFKLLREYHTDVWTNKKACKQRK